MTPFRFNSTRLLRQLITCSRPFAFRHHINSHIRKDNCRREISGSPLTVSEIRFRISSEKSLPPTLTTPRLYKIFFAVSTFFCG
jgi:hypothetical protein